ncbi:MAG: hypothetical protein N2748_06535, partial [candidate division WOR-3 bacterium]|nr:hypothetical protein [candidate division WOR-3 bacterium]
SNAVLGYQIPSLGFWSPTLATGLILIGMLIGVVIYLFSKQPKIRTSQVFIGGEIISAEMATTISLPDGRQTLTRAVDVDEAKVPGTAFYDSVKKIKLLADTYHIAETKFFDIFEQTKKFINMFVRAGRAVHNGLLHNYLGWLFLGFITIVAIIFAIRYF